MPKFQLPLAKFAALAAVTALGLSACGGTSEASSSLPDDITTVTIGVADGAEPYWQVYKKVVKEETGVDVEFKNFSDYNQPNPALDQKQLDLNEFQHLQYLATYNTKNDKDLQPIGGTAVYPLPLYSTQYSSTEEIPKGSEIAIPNDPVNLARSLIVLEAAGLVEVEGGADSTSTPTDVDTAASKVKVVTVDAKMTAQNLDSLAGAVVNNNYAAAADLSDDDIIAQDDPEADSTKPYINAFVARDADKTNPTLLEVAKLYHDPEVVEAIKKDLGTGGVFRENSGEDLQSALATIEENMKADSQ
ncbi:MAG: MetQ/NlpA family ABC transporter substrate-binding protein [Arthrobacter sp.]|uniref:MetQ/NlpA family ABC transporter substrate-binding protein n=1 Tax=unclassified Arthrobacter TaxID=235627 RepID=UPI00264DDA1F|nr:MetQ/NlpA family ABC transporter substrate-binding protein [Micrococcaceae bacterium]MDN5813936.1 MetQ/NlpA family ABC transporter substrate-binding protein [Micrococcaceae bacterium]MDN5824271.1 MetQ/NlpA family ABC transporter substrate-binding protein [Micrococcaceae bacterium]MDN5879439.1 MetQ/NlpA family ABC transporter substrate-binding protein [Micrococcaceae bacterium]MDN5887507.1 MetQ/NlpA family ABC transporter substrate-binding protein [Micrococcaceae bacterium]